MTQAARWIPVAAFFAAALSFSQLAKAEMACTECHDVLDREYVHEPAVADCTTCHYEHDLDTAPSRKLKAPVTELCLGCHSDILLRLDGGHPAKGHPYWIERDPMWDNGDPERKVPEFNCTNCHNPHSADLPALFRWNYMKPQFNGNPCATCHKDIAYGAWVPPKPDYDSPRLPPKKPLFGGRPETPQNPKNSNEPEEPKKKKRWWEYLFSYEPSLRGPGRR